VTGGDNGVVTVHDFFRHERVPERVSWTENSKIKVRGSEAQGWRARGCRGAGFRICGL